MKASERFIDTNLLLYLLSADTRKADIAEQELEQGGTVSVQVLNEFSSVALRKFKMPLAEVREVLAGLRAACSVVPLTEAVHDKGLELVERNGLSVYDAMIVAAALLAGCKTLLSEDMQHDQLFQRTLRVRNPFQQ